MIDFQYWIKNIVSQCELIVSPDTYERVWLQGDRTITSVIHPVELFEQLLGDLDLEECAKTFADRLSAIGALDAVLNFTSALLSAEHGMNNDPSLKDDPRNFLASTEWQHVKAAAKTIVELPFAAEYRRTSR